MISPRLTDIATLRHYLQKEGIRPDKHSGQNFLICDEVIEAILSCLAGAPARATELGAGAGVLTQALAGSGFAVKAIERDEALARILRAALPPNRRRQVEIMPDDLKTTAWQQAEPYVLVGNIPYNLSGLIVRRAVQLEKPPERMVFLVQQEVGQRLTAGPPQLSLIGLATQLWGIPELAMRVPPTCFWPQPQVYSAVVCIAPRSDRLPLAKREAILAVAKQFFRGRRKQIGGQMQRLFGLSKKEMEAICKDTGVRPTRRPQEIGVEQWKLLARTLFTFNKESKPF